MLKYTMEIIYQIIILSLITFGFVFFVIPNLIVLRNSKEVPVSPDPPPLISILIPARNEAPRIERTLRSLLKSSYPNIEILVLDDNSTDTTASIVALMSEEDDRIRLISGKPLEEGWMGKNFACFQLSQEARGEFYFFTDADIEATHDLIPRALAASLKNQADCLTGMPRLWSRSFWGKVVVPNAHFMLLGYLPVFLAQSRNFPKITFGCGVFLFFKRHAYEALGGHSTIRECGGEDVALAQQVKAAGMKLHFMDPSPYLSSEMYENFNEVWQGYGKSIFMAFETAPLYFSVFVTTICLLYLLPFYFLYHYGYIAPNDTLGALVFTQVLLGYGFRLLAAIRFRLSWESVVFHPLSTALMVIIGIRSAWIHMRKVGYEWKGRVYR